MTHLFGFIGQKFLDKNILMNVTYIDKSYIVMFILAFMSA